jgi:nucleoside-diphosphate-sugar epimerase
MMLGLLMNRVQLINSSLQPLIVQLEPGLFQSKKIFITGGTGFFGLWILSGLELLHNAGAEFEVVVLSRNPILFLANNPRWLNLEWLKFQRGDVRNFQFLRQQFDYLIHAATDTSQGSQSNPLSTFQDMVAGTRRVLEFAVAAGIKRALFTSSGAVYGGNPSAIDRIPESALFACDPTKVTSAYGEGKRVMELLASIYYEKYGVESVSARCFAFVGPGLPLDKHFAIGNFIHDALYSDFISIKSDGSSVRSYLYGADLAVWLLKLLVSGEPGKAYNVGSDQSVDMRVLAQLVADVVCPGKRVVVENLKYSKINDRSIYVPEIKLSRDNVQLDVWTDLTAAIQLTARYQLLSK